MFLDALGLVSNAQALTATAVSTDKIDLGNVTPNRQIGTGEPMGFGVTIDVAADFTSMDETYQFDVVSDADAALGSPTVHSSTVIAAANLTAGAAFFLPLPQGVDYERYLGLRYTLGGMSPTVTVTAWLTTHSMFSLLAKAYAKNYAV